MKQIIKFGHEPIGYIEVDVDESADKKPGDDFCQVCGEATKFVGGPSYDLEHFECRKCGALHIIRLEFLNGKAVKRVLESVY